MKLTTRDWTICVLLLASSSCATQAKQRELAQLVWSPAVLAPQATSTQPVPQESEAYPVDSYELKQEEPGSDWPPPVHDSGKITFIRAEQLEYRLRDDQADQARWEVQGWYGGDYQKLWIKTEGERSVEGRLEQELEFQALYSELVAPFWDFQVGLRYDKLSGPGPDPDRWFGVVGFQGFAPYEFETELALFVSEDADLSARVTASTDFLFTQRLILQPRFESELAWQEVREFDVGQGLNYADLSVRLRYEIEREFAPYFGISWIRSLGESEDLIRRAGGEESDLSLVFGVSAWL